MPDGKISEAECGVNSRAGYVKPAVHARQHCGGHERIPVAVRKPALNARYAVPRNNGLRKRE